MFLQFNSSLGVLVLGSIEKKPVVELVAHTQLSSEGISSYLGATGNEDFDKSIGEAFDAGLSGMEVLVSMMAKLCYKSFTLGHNANITRVRDIRSNIEAAIKSGHGCYDDETEVLTETGWKRWDEVTLSDRLATRNKNGDTEYHVPQKLLIGQPYKGRMYRVESQDVDLFVTPNHNMFVCKTTTLEGRKRDESSYGLVKADELGCVSHAYVKSGRFSCSDTSKHIPASILKLIGFAIGDGNVDGAIRFRLRRERKISWLQSAAKDAGCELVSNEDRYTLRPPSEYRRLFDEIYDEHGEKQIPQWMLVTQSMEGLQALYEGLQQSDGHVGKTSESYDSTSIHLIGQVQQLCMHIGLSANLIYSSSQEDRNSMGDKVLHRLGIIRRNNKPEVNKWVGQVGKTHWIEEWEGVVHCAQVPNNTLYVRRNGRPVWCGNSVLEHASMSFIVRDCSRIFTHELVRHRAGSAFSQNSGRYIRLDAIDIVVDPILKPVEEDIREITEYLESRYAVMAEKLGMNAEGLDFNRKKKLTSALRRIAPNGQTNEIGFTLNLRALRFVIQKRTDAAAEWEIRHVFAQVYEIAKELVPTLFCDESVTLVDGLPMVQFNHQT